MPATFSRRNFIAAGSATASLNLLPRSVKGAPAASEKLNIAVIGTGGRGQNLLSGMAPKNNIVALCDVDERSMSSAAKKFPNAKRHQDFRRMFESQKDIDAVVVSTPDHLHYVAAMWAIKHGKHVYCEKPMTPSIAQGRALAKAADEAGVATQMGNQGNADEGVRRMQEWIDAGALGPVREVHAWTNKPVWPQGIGRPHDKPAVPDALNWDLWLGSAPERPYHPDYLPFKWRGWWDFGSCSLGDMGCHVLNTPWRALNLGLPTSIEAYSNGCTSETGPLSSVIYYQFPARGTNPAVKLTWYDGNLMPPRPSALEDHYRLGDNEGVLFVGDEASMICTCYGGNPRILPKDRMQAYKDIPKSLDRSPGHFEEWFAACKGGPKAGSHFGHARILNEVVQLGNVAIRSSADQKQSGYPVKLVWDADAGEVSNAKEANQYVSREARKGWEV
jgi:hypothetical protein